MRIELAKGTRDLQLHPQEFWDATRTEASPELLQRAFELAYFIFPDRSAAVDIVVRALEKLRVLSRREMKRMYWRDKHAGRPVRRVARTDHEMLQWLIMFESEEKERTEELAGNASPKALVISYVKHLLQTTTALSSFYVNVGLTRLLHSYTTVEAQQVYEMLTSRFIGPDAYRRAKSVLMDKMSQRFASLVHTTRVDHGELRFESGSNQEQWTRVVNDCLRVFAPWSAGAEHPGREAGPAITNLLALHAHPDNGQNEIEKRCCEILIEPSSYNRIMQELGLLSPDKKLDLPRFFMPERSKRDNDDGARMGPSELSEAEIHDMRRRLEVTDRRRRKIATRSVSAMVDGVQVAEFDLAQQAEVRIELEAGASLIEIRGKDENGELILATHLVSYVNNEFECADAISKFPHGKLNLSLTPIVSTEDTQPRATLDLKYQPNLGFSRTWTIWGGFSVPLKFIRNYALATISVILIAWGVVGAFYAHRVRVLERQLQEARPDRQLLLPREARAIFSYRLSRDDERVRSMEGDNIPEISLQLHAAAVILEIPVPTKAAGASYSAELKTFEGDRVLLTQNFIEPPPSNVLSTVEIVVPAQLLQADNYYTVHLHAKNRTDHFTFRVVGAQR